MWDRDFLDKWDMGRRVEARLFCFGSGSQDAADEARATATPAETDDKGRPLVRGTSNVIDLSRQILPPQNNDPEPVAAVENNPPRGAIRVINSGGADLLDISQAPPAANPIQAPIQTIDTMLDKLARLEARDAERRARFGGQTAADVQALNAQAGQVYYDERTGTYKAGSLPDLVVDRTPPPYNEIQMYAVPRVRSNINVVGSNMPPEFITDERGVTFNTTTGEIVQPQVIGMEDEYDPFDVPGERTAMNILNYNLDDQSGPRGRVRPFAGLTREQQADIEARDDFVAKRIRAAQTEQPSGIPTTDLTGIYTFGDQPDGNVRGFSSLGPDLPFLGQSLVYTGYGQNPFAPPPDPFGDDNQRTVAPIANPMTDKPRCPEGYIFDEDLQACRLDVSGSARQTAGSESDIYYRRTALDDAPANLPTGFDFDAANRRFIQSYGARPDFYRSPMSLTGFTRLT